MMKKNLLIMLMITLLCTGCAHKQNDVKPDDGMENNRVMYSNLADEASQKGANAWLITA